MYIGFVSRIAIITYLLIFPNSARVGSSSTTSNSIRRRPDSRGSISNNNRPRHNWIGRRKGRKKGRLGLMYYNKWMRQRNSS